MKKITQLFLTILFTSVVALVSAQSLTLTGNFTNGASANMDISVYYGTGMDSVETDALGNFTAGPYTVANTQGSGTIFYTDCNGAQSFPFSWNPASLTVNVGSIDLCPSVSSFDVSTSFQFSNSTGPISFDLSWDNGLTFTTETTDANGDFTFTNTGLTSGGTLVVSFDDCNGMAQSFNYSYSSANNAINDNFDFCPVACEASFYFYQNNVMDSMQNIVSYGNIEIVDLSSSANPINALTHTWTFGDNSPSYTGTNFTHTYTAAGTYNVCLTIDNGNGCTDTQCVDLVVNANGVLSGKANGGFSITMGAGENETAGPTGINDLAKDVTLNIYPNPASNNINLSLNSEINETVSLEIYNVTGKLVQQNNIEVSNGNQVVNVALNNLNKGLYIAQIKSTKGTLSTKITIK